MGTAGTVTVTVYAFYAFYAFYALGHGYGKYVIQIYAYINTMVKEKMLRCWF
jgi:hypothetical protein